MELGTGQEPGCFSREPLRVGGDAVEGKQQSRPFPKGSLRVKGRTWEQPASRPGEKGISHGGVKGYVVGVRKCIVVKIRGTPERVAPILLARRKPAADTCQSWAGTGFP